MKIGPGGFKCKCCNPFSKKKQQAKKVWSRYKRRTAKQELKNDNEARHSRHR